MTDNKVFVFSDGIEAVRCHRGDGWAVGRLRKAGYHQLILSTEKNDVVGRRADKLGIPCVQGSSDKRASLLAYAKENKIDLRRAAYVGNDENDLPAMDLVAFRIAPADATAKVLASADHVTTARGGDGVIRELMDGLSLGTAAKLASTQRRKSHVSKNRQNR